MGCFLVECFLMGCFLVGCLGCFLVGCFLVDRLGCFLFDCLSSHVIPYVLLKLSRENNDFFQMKA